MKKSIVLFMLLAVVTTVSAQVTTAALSGIITDTLGVLPGAEVSATYVPTGVVYHDVTGDDGEYHFFNILPGGPYIINVSSVGYQSLTVHDIFLHLADNNTLNLHMQEEKIGLTEVVITAKDFTRMSSHLAGSVTTFTSYRIGLLPTPTRTLNDVLSLTPQASSTSDGLAIGGGNYRQSNVMVDGAVFNNSFGIGPNLPAGGSPISLEAMDQLSISITPYDVRQSGFVGGAIQATTKSGTNEWHASAYDYFQHRDLQGKKMGMRDENGIYPATLQLTDMLRNTVGFTVGGPIIKDKLFLFLNAEYEVDNNPGQSRKASTDGIAQGQYNRPTVQRLSEMREYLIHRYDYDPGMYDSFSFNTPDWKFFARMDWNINSLNRLTLRYSFTGNKTMSYPSTSVAPFGNTTLYNRYLNGRASPYAMYFQHTCYAQEENFGSLAAEWTIRLLGGRATNTLRGTWSHQLEPRSFQGKLFPTVDILEPLPDGTRAVYATFGIDPFTYGNERNVHSVSAVEEFTYRTGLHTIMTGATFDYVKAQNGFMQMGAGYYLYNSWDDFVNDAKPLAFAITHSNRDDLRQQYPTLSNMNFALYLQDEVKVNRQFNLIFGARMDVPVYAKTDNENKAFTALFAETTGWRTDNVPGTYFSFSPRIGFNWDILDNRKLILRGGTGYFVGSIPMVWLVSAVGNSNTMQQQIMLYDSEGVDMHFHDNIDDILQEYYHGTFHQQELAAPTAPTILAKDLHMPSTWKSSLALDYLMPGGIKLGVEGIFNKDINAVVISKGGLILHKNGLVLTEGIDVRDHYTDAGLGTNPYIVHNASKTGYYASVTTKIEKNFPCGISLAAAYTFSHQRTVSDGLGDQVASVFSFNTYSINGSSKHELGNSSFVSPNRVLANISYVIEEGRHATTTLAMYYEGSHMGAVAENTYTCWTPTMSANLTGEGGSNNVIYIPTEAEMEKMNFVSDNNKAAFNRFICEHRELKSHRGHYAERGCMKMPWHSQINVKIKQNIHFDDHADRQHNMEIGVDIRNFLNLLKREWGNLYCVDNTDILKWENGVYTFDPVGGAGMATPSSSTLSTWSMMLSMKYFF